MTNTAIAKPWSTPGHRKVLNLALNVAASAALGSLAYVCVDAFVALAMSPDWTSSGLAMNEAMHAMFLAGILCFSAALIWRKLTFARIGILAACGLFGSDFVEMTAHPSLIAAGLHPLQFLGYKDYEINPQWLKVIMATVTGLICAVLIFDRKWRSIDRIFLIAIASSVSLTTFGFHTVARYGIFQPALHSIEQRIADAMTGDLEDLPRLCSRWAADCFRTAKDQVNNVSFEGRNLSASERSWFVSVSDGLSRMESAVHLGHISDQDGSIAPPRRVLALATKGNEAFGVSLKGLSMEANGLSQTWFSFLAIVAHSTWLFGGLSLLYWHKRRQRRRATS